MYQSKNVWIPAAACVLALAIACSKSSDAPIAPSGAQPGVSEAAPDGSTLKVTAPGPQSPVNGQQPDGTLVLVTTPSTGKFANAGALDVPLSGFQCRQHQCLRGLRRRRRRQRELHAVEQRLSAGLRCAAHVESARRIGTLGRSVVARPRRSGHRSAATSRGNELFDPLTNGASTVMTASSGVTWLPGVGVRLEHKDSSSSTGCSSRASTARCPR